MPSVTHGATGLTHEREVGLELLARVQEGRQVRLGASGATRLESFTRGSDGVDDSSAHGWTGRHLPRGYSPDAPAWLSENDSPGRAPYAEPAQEAEDRETPSWTEERVVWIPSAPEHILEDGVLLIAVHVLWGEEAARDVVEELGVPELLDFDFLELEKMPKDALADLRTRCAEIDLDCKLVVTVLESSSVRGQLSALECYPMEFEVCTVSYSRLRPRRGGGEMRVRGSLTASWRDDEPPGHRYHDVNIH